MEVQVIGQESNSHYHVHIACFKRVDPLFRGEADLVISDELKRNLQKVHAPSSLCHFFYLQEQYIMCW